MPPKRSLKSANGHHAELDAGPSSKKTKKSAKSAPKNKSTLAPKTGASKAGGSMKSNQSQKIPKVLPRAPLAMDPEQQKTLNEQLFSAVNSASSLELIKQLVEKGADVNAKDERGNPLIFDALSNEELLKFLMSLGADPDCINAEGRTLLSVAIDDLLGCDDTSLFKTLFEGGADVNFVNKENNELPPFWNIITNGEEKQIDLFLEYGADVTTYDQDGNSLLSFLTGLDTDMVPLREWELERFVVKYTRIFKSRGAKLSRADIEDSNTLQKYLECGEEKEARVFVKEYKKGFRGVERPLFVAAYNPHMKCLKFLLKSGLFDVNEKDSSGRTALHNAAYCENESNTRLLLEHGADPNVADRWGTTPYEIAKSEEHDRHMHLLTRYGAESPQRDSDDSDD